MCPAFFTFTLAFPRGGQTAISVRWSAVQQTTKMIADQLTSANGLPKMSFRYSAVLHLLLKKIYFKAKK